MDHILPPTDGEHIYVAGKVGGGSYNPYEVAYIAKFKTDGTFLWVKKTSSSGSESWGVAEASNGDLITGFGVGGAQVIDFGDGAELEPNSIGWFGALVRFDKDGTVKVLKYVADALYTDPSSVGAQALRLYHLSIDRSDQVILTGELTGTHQFKNNLEATSTPGLGGSASKNAGIIICDLNFNPLAVYTNTGGNNEWGRKSVSKGDKIYYSGEYESVTHAFFGTFQAEFGDFIFASAGDQDIYVASLSVPIPPPPPEVRLSIAKQADAFIISWPSFVSDAVPESSSNLETDAWDALNETPSLVEDHWQLTLPEPSDSSFYRLRYQE